MYRGGIGRIQRDDRETVGALKDSAGHRSRFNGLWGIEFGGGSSSNGQKNQLFFTAGPKDTDGYFGVISFK